MVAVTPVSPDATEAGWPESPGPVAVARAPAAAWAECWTGPVTGDAAAWRTGATLLLTPVTGVLTVPVPALATVLLTKPFTLVTGPLTVAGTPPAGEAGDCFGLALDAVPGAVPVLWPPPWPGRTSWVTAWTAEVTALVAVGAGDAGAPPLDAAGCAAGALAAGALAAGGFAAGTAGRFAAGSAGTLAAGAA